MSISTNSIINDPVDSNLNNLIISCEKYLDDDFVFKTVKIKLNKKIPSGNAFNLDESRNYIWWLIILKRTPATKTNELRKDVEDETYAKFRGSEFLVVQIIDIFNSNKTINSIYNQNYIGVTYAVDRIVKPNKYDENIHKVCSNGIHFFKTIKGAYYYNLKSYNHTGKYLKYHDNGLTFVESTFIKGKLNGVSTKYYENGKKHRECTYIDDKINGSYFLFHPNGVLRMEGVYVNGLKKGNFTEYNHRGNIIKIYKF